MMMTLSVVGMILGLLLLAVPAYMIYAYDRLSAGKVALAVARMLVQTVVMGGCLWLIYRYDSVWLSLLWLALLVLSAAFLMVSRTHIRSRVLFLPACIGMFVSVLMVSGYLLFAVIRPSDMWSVRWFVPVTSVLMAHVLTTNIPAVRTYFDSLKQDGQPYYTQLGNGGSRLQALSPYVTRALRSVTMPAVASLSAMGLFGVPLLLSGMLMGGMTPVTAVGMLILFVVSSLCASVASIVLTLWISDRYAFNKQGQLGDIFTAG